MPSDRDFPARGKVIRTTGDSVIFVPTNTNYEVQLKLAGGKYDGPLNTPVEAFLRLTARKVYTVPSGGNFLVPIFGPPKIVQGRVRLVTDQLVVLQAGVPVIVTFPAADTAMDLAEGAEIREGTIVNATILPGATFELAQVAAAAR